MNESKSFKIGLPYLIKRNAACHGFDINFFLSFIFYSLIFMNIYLVTGTMLLGFKDQQSMALKLLTH